MENLEIESVTKKIKKYVKKHVKKSRYEHSLRTAKMAYSLCEKYGVNPSLGFLAGIAHDMCKDLSDGDMIELAIKDKICLSDLEVKKPALLHGRAACILLENEFGISDPDVIEAVRYHTFGKKGMCDLASIIFVADKIEPGREHVTADYLARLDGLSLRELVVFVLEENITYLQSKGKNISELTFELLESLKN